jgi:hypothetical protein
MTSAELIAELQAARPTADADLRDRIRTIAAAEPVGRSPRFRLPRFADRRMALITIPATAVVLLGVAGVAGLLDSGGQPSQPAVRESARQLTPPAAADRQFSKAAAGTAAAATAGGSSAGTTPPPTPDRLERYSAQLTLSVKDVDALSSATQQALRITRDLGGYLVTASYATSDTGTSSLTLKVPTASVQEAVVRLSGLGKIVSQQVQIDDLQAQADELTKQETVLRERIARLSARLADPSLDAETRATLEARRDAARSELARARTAAAQVRAEARYATIQLGLQTRQSTVVPAAPSRFDRGVDRAVEILAVEATVALYALAILGPLALLALATWLGLRGLRRRQEGQLLSRP